jgi:hypothetical protein
VTFLRRNVTPPPKFFPGLFSWSGLQLSVWKELFTTTDTEDTEIAQRLEYHFERLPGHSRLLSLLFEGTPDEVWAGLARHGRPIQYAHVSTPLALWDVWTRIAGPPVAFEPPSAELDAGGYRTHEFGDSVLIERVPRHMG